MTTSTLPQPQELDSDAIAQRVLDASLGLIDALAIYVGDRLGWYRSLADDGPATPELLAERCGTDPRYTREWLEQQAVTGLVSVEDGEYALPPAAAEVLTDASSLAYLAPLPRMLTASATQLPALLRAYQDGGGVTWAELGKDAREAQADMNRPWFERALPDALRSVPHLHERLSARDVKIADLGCGGGWSSIALARTYPDAVVDAVDIDAPSVVLARGNLSGTEVSDRVRFHLGDAAELPTGAYDAVFLFECLHDMPQPVEVLAAARQALAPGRSVIVMDEAVADSFTAPGDDLERLMYGFSLLMCLPDGMAHPPSAATGTVMRLDTLRRYAEAAGFTGVEVLPISDFGFWRFYELTT